MKVRKIMRADDVEWMRLALWPQGSADGHRAEMQEQFDNAKSFAVFVADRGDGTLGGFLEASLRAYADGCDTRPVGYIEGWYVDEDLRRRGVGGELVKMAEQWASDQGCQQMASDCLIDNDVSYTAHLALGYQEAERLIHFKKDLPGYRGGRGA